MNSPVLIKKLLLLVMSVFVVNGNVEARGRLDKTRTVEAVCKAYPKRVEALFKNLDLKYPGLEEVKKAVEKKDYPGACNAILAYYKKGSTADWLRKASPKPGTGKDELADALLEDTFTIQRVTAKQPRRKDGGLDWGHLGPRKDKEWGWLLNRHGHFNVLLRVFMETGNPIYAARFDEHIRDWVCANPFPKKDVSSVQWRVLEAGLRISSAWPKAFYGFQGTDEFSAGGRILMLSSIPEHVECCRKFHAKKGNHLLMEMYGMVSAAVSWPEFKKSSSWIDYAIKRMTPEMTKQVYPDGVQMELTSHYHWVSLINFEKLADAVGRVGRKMPADYRKRLLGMWNYLAYSIRPDGHGVLNNDSDLDDNRSKLRGAAQRYKRDDWLYLITNGKKGSKPKGSASIMFPWAGQLVMRDGYGLEAQWGFFDVGPWGLSHQHNDKLHLSVSAHGRDLLVDSGRFAYTGTLAKKFRKPYARHSAGHNVILIDGAGQEKGPKTTKVPLTKSDFRIEKAFDYARGSFNKFEKIKGKLKHTRAVFYVRGEFWIVVDRIETDRPRELQALWHWHPHCTVEIKDGHILSTDAGKGNLRIIPFDRKAWKLKMVKGQNKPRAQGWYSEKYNKVEPSPTAVCSVSIKGTENFAWILLPAKGEVPLVDVSISSQSKDQMILRVIDSKKNQFEVTVPLSKGMEPGLKRSKKKN